MYRELLLLFLFPFFFLFSPIFYYFFLLLLVFSTHLWRRTLSMYVGMKTLLARSLAHMHACERKKERKCYATIVGCCERSNRCHPFSYFTLLACLLAWFAYSSIARNGCVRGRRGKRERKREGKKRDIKKKEKEKRRGKEEKKRGEKERKRKRACFAREITCVCDAIDRLSKPTHTHTLAIISPAEEKNSNVDEEERKKKEKRKKERKRQEERLNAWGCFFFLLRCRRLLLAHSIESWIYVSGIFLTGEASERKKRSFWLCQLARPHSDLMFVRPVCPNERASEKPGKPCWLAANHPTSGFVWLLRCAVNDCSSTIGCAYFLPNDHPHTYEEWSDVRTKSRRRRKGRRKVRGEKRKRKRKRRERSNRLPCYFIDTPILEVAS